MFIGKQADGSISKLESRDVTFLENDFPQRGDITSDLDLFEIDESETSTTPIQLLQQVEDNHEELHPSGSERNVNIPEEGQLRRSVRTPVPRRRFDIESEALMLQGEEEMVQFPEADEPKTINKALSSPAIDKWKNAMEEEMKSMKVNNVWTLVDLPKGRKAIDNKWVLKLKRKADGSVKRYKARLVTQGYTQQEGIDYEETFSPVVRFTSIRLLLSIVAHLDLELHQMDVKTAFLNGELDEEIYMQQPTGFVVPGQENKVCKLQRLIYGLK